MAQLLTQEWLDEQRSRAATLPQRPGASARIEYQVSGGPDGGVTFHTVLEDGHIVENRLGADPDAEFAVILAYDDFVAVTSGELDPAVGFMQGRIKVTGNIGKMLAVMPVTASQEWKQAMSSAGDQP